MSATVTPGRAVTPGGSVRRVVALFGPLRWWIVAAALLSAITFAAGIGLLSMAGYLISRSALVDTTATLTLAIVGVRFFAVVRAVGRYLERYVGHLGTFRILTRVRVWFFRRIEPLAPAALLDDRAGDVLTRIVDDVETLQDLPLRVLAPPLAALLAGTVGVAVLGSLDPVLAVALVVFLVLTGMVLPMATRGLGRAAADVLTVERARLNSVAVESVSALADLVAYGREDLVGGRLDELTERRRAAERRLAAVRGLNIALAGALGGLAAVAALALAIPLVTDGRLDGVMLAVVPLAVVATFEAVAPLTQGFEHLDRSRGAAQRLMELVDREPTVHDPISESEEELTGAGSVEFDQVGFRYADDGPDVLVGASFVVPAGAQVAVVGPSGAGKSTIASLLLRFWEQQTGTIRIDGVDIRAVPAAASRAAVAVVAQHDHLFDTTVRDNLLLGDPESDDERIWSVLEAVALDEVVRALPGGLDERAGEDGQRFSGGERQRLMIARALLAESSVLVLDEATAHLDPATEAQVLAGVGGWRKGRTTVHIAHHAAALGSPDLVLRVEDGRVLPGTA
ncbi:MAG TPA: thiol reductant ABC exporter subunit CydC [Acidimicrobiales bacterium]